MIEVFADLHCPFTHVGLTRILAVRDELGVDEPVVVKAWPLEVVNGEALSGALVAEEIAELRRTVAPDLFTGFDRDRLPSSTLLPLALVAATYRDDPRAGEQLSVALRRALFEEGLDVSEPPVLSAVARGVGVPDRPPDFELVRAEWLDGRRRGVQGSPLFRR